MTEVVEATDAAASWVREERRQIRVRRPPFGSEEAGDQHVHAVQDVLLGRGRGPWRRRWRRAPAEDANRAIK